MGHVDNEPQRTCPPTEMEDTDWCSDDSDPMSEACRSTCAEWCNVWTCKSSLCQGCMGEKQPCWSPPPPAPPAPPSPPCPPSPPPPPPPLQPSPPNPPPMGPPLQPPAAPPKPPNEDDLRLGGGAFWIMSRSPPGVPPPPPIFPPPSLPLVVPATGMARFTTGELGTLLVCDILLAIVLYKFGGLACAVIRRRLPHVHNHMLVVSTDEEAPHADVDVDVDVPQSTRFASEPKGAKRASGDSTIRDKMNHVEDEDVEI